MSAGRLLTEKILKQEFKTDVYKIFLVGVRVEGGKDMKRVWRILAGVLIFVAGLGMFAFPVGNDKISERQTIQFTHSGIDFKFTCQDGMFLQSSTFLNPEMVKMSMALSAAAYDEKTIVETILREQLHFLIDNDYHSEYERRLSFDDNDYVAFTIAHKRVGNYIVYLVPIRGTANNAEWYSNFNLGEGKVHEGFRIAAQRVYEELETVLAGDGIDKEHTVILLTGHSRGAAISNLLAGWLTQSRKYSDPEHIFGYTFACPGVSMSADTTLKNIYNFNNPGDLIPLLPLEEWGFNRYGITISEISDSEWIKISNEYEERSKETMNCERTPSGYRRLLHKIVSERAEYDEPEKKAEFTFLAWVLGGCNDTTEEETKKIFLDLGLIPLEKHFSETTEKEEKPKFRERLWNALISNGTRNIETIYHLKKMIECAQCLDFVQENKEEVTLMTEKQFAKFCKKYKRKIKRTEKLTGTDINTTEDFLKAEDSIQIEISRIAEMNDAQLAVWKLVYWDGGIIKIGDKVIYGHQPLTYLYWINTRYSG